MKLASYVQLNLQNIEPSDLQEEAQTGLLLFDKSPELYLSGLAKYFIGTIYLMSFQHV